MGACMISRPFVQDWSCREFIYLLELLCPLGRFVADLAARYVARPFF